MCHEYAVVPHGNAGQVQAVLMPGRGTQAPLSHGVFGGYPGCNTASIRFRQSNQDDWPHDLASTSGRAISSASEMGITELGDEDVLYIRHDGAGGYGDPLEREPEAVLGDVLAGLVSEQAAHGLRRRAGLGAAGRPRCHRPAEARRQNQRVGEPDCPIGRHPPTGGPRHPSG